MKLRPLLTPKGHRRSFSAIFKQVTPDAPKWRIVGSGVKGYPVEAEYTSAVVEALEANGVTVREYTMCSPVNIDSHHLEAKFADGGLIASTGHYWYGRKGAWLEGRETAEWVAKLLDLKLPLEWNQTCD